MEPVLEIIHLSKSYDLGSASLGSVKQDFARFWKRLTGKEASNPLNTYVALNDVSFCLQKGEVLGIMGRNGAGKSTLLKLISRITAPTSGQIVVRGKVTSLLEVGTGFHPDLSGRENVFLNGAIHGLKRAAIKEKFNEIVEFSGIGQFIDVPVKKYSSGMFVRLAFSVAVHLDPQILILDEVLSVGDAEFQEKSFAKIEEFRRSDTTILFVSHDPRAVRSMCSRAILLDQGKLVADDTVDKILHLVQSAEKSS